MRRSQSSRKIAQLLGKPERIRNFCILAHVDHGKTTLADALVASNGIISQRLAGKLRYMDSREDEQLRGITMKSSSIALHFENNQIDYLINMIDSPGHIDFASEVSTAVQLCDGAIIVVDVVEGVCPQTHAALRQSWHEHLKPVLVLNKIDRLIVELRLSPSEAYNHLLQVLEQVNAITGELFSRDLHEKTASRETSELASPEERLSDWTVGDDNSDDSHLYFTPESGNVIFASALDGWGFCVEDFASMFASKVGINSSVLKKTLWGDFYLNSKAKRIQKGAQDKGKKPLFVQFVLENLWSVYEAVSIRRDIEKIEKIIGSLGLKVNPRDIKHNDSRLCLNAIFNQWLPLSKAVLSMVAEKLPSPLDLTQEKVEGLMCHKIQKFESLHSKTQELSRDFLACKSSDATVIVYVSKMLPYDRKSLPVNRPKPLTVEEIAARRELARQKHMEMTNRETQVSFDDKPQVQQISSEERNDGPVFIAFARIYSGSITKGQKLFVLGPKHDPKTAVDMSHDDVTADVTARDLSSLKHVTSFEVGDLYMLMGRELEEIEVAAAGNIVGIGGLEDHVLKSATLSTTVMCPPFTETMFQAKPIVRVAIDPENPTEMSRLVEGMKLLNQADPCVEVRVQETGEHVIIAAGEVHLQRCVEDLKLRYAQIELNVSAPIVPFRETIVIPPQVDMVNEAIQDQLQSPLAEEKPITNDLIEITTPDNAVSIAIRARPLPDEVISILVENTDLLKTFNKFSWQYQNIKGRKATLNEATRKDLCNLREKMDEAFRNAGDSWLNAASRIWCFGPHHRGPNVLLNGITDYERPSVWQCLDEGVEGGQLRELDNSIVSGFQIATRAGPLCEEPVMGVCYVVERWEWLHGQPALTDDREARNDGRKEAASAEAASVDQAGSQAASVKPAESDAAYVKPPGSEDTSVKPPDSETTCVKPAGSETTSVKPPGSEDTSVKPPGSETTSVKPPGSEDTSVKPPDSETTSVKSAGSGATSGQLISCVKDACRKAFQTQPQRLMAAMYSCEIQANGDVLGKLYAVIGKRNGRVVYEDLKEGSAAFIVKAVIPVVDSFGFAEEIRKKTSGLAIPQLQFSHWERIDTDPFWVPTTEEEYLYHGQTADSDNQARKYMNDVRRRKGLGVDEQIVEFAEKQRTLTRNK